MENHNLSQITLKDLAYIISTTLGSKNIHAVLVGGACVTIYSENRYQSSDLDFVTHEDMKSVAEALATLGFMPKGRYFVHLECPFFIDFLNPPVAVGQQSIKTFKTLTSRLGTLQLLTPTDCVKDRLAAYFFWNDQQALEQACLVASHAKINLQEIRLWAKKEGHIAKFDHFIEELKNFTD